MQEFDSVESRKTGFWDAYKAFRKKFDLAKLNIEPADVFDNVRDRSPGRKVRLQLQLRT